MRFWLCHLSAELLFYVVSFDQSWKKEEEGGGRKLCVYLCVCLLLLLLLLLVRRRRRRLVPPLLPPAGTHTGAWVRRRGRRGVRGGVGEARPAEHTHTHTPLPASF